MTREEAEALVAEYWAARTDAFGCVAGEPKVLRRERAYERLIAALMRAEPEPDPVGEAIALAEEWERIEKLAPYIRQALRVLIDAAREGRGKAI